MKYILLCRGSITCWGYDTKAMAMAMAMAMARRWRWLPVVKYCYAGSASFFHILLNSDWK